MFAFIDVLPTENSKRKWLTIKSVPFSTSNQILIPPIFLIIPYSNHHSDFLSLLIILSAYLLIPFVLFLFTPALLFCPPLHVPCYHSWFLRCAPYSCWFRLFSLFYWSFHCKILFTSHFFYSAQTTGSFWWYC